MRGDVTAAPSFLFSCYPPLFWRLRHGRAQRDELLGGGRVDGDGLVELRLRGAHLHGDGQGLDDLGRIEADHVGADDPLAGAVDHQLHHGLFVAAGKRVLQRAERAAIDVDGAVAAGALPPR
jgi:hypothetical protein